METKLNIAEILKNKPKETKLYADAFGELSIKDIDVESEPSITLLDKSGYMLYFYSNGKYSLYGEPILFPSKEMQNWSKFVWKKGNVLIRTNSEYCVGIFDEWTSDDFSTFSAKYINLGLSDDFSCSYTCKTEEWEKAKYSKNYISEIERVMNGKLNLETLEIEKTQPEFKDGDILCLIDNSNKYHYILIYKSQDNENIYRYVTMFEDNYLNMKEGSYLTKPKDYSMRYATDEEKQQFFDTLAKKDKAWDFEKKEIIDLKPKVNFRPFDKVVACCVSTHKWECDMFSHYSKDYRGREIIIGLGGLSYYKALPYNEENAKLLGTTDNVED